ncbi:MAG: signal recognition particle protein [Armatimonadetes bacterium]|nr:signal recognition particle protein [Armatimonadota bacterium]
MFDTLTEKLQSVFSRLRGRGRLSEQDINEALREVRLALLEADVSFRVVKEFVQRVKERALGQEVFESLTGAQTVVRIVHSELTSLLGGADARVSFAPKPPTVIMLCGLQGSGKTTTCGKLANWMRKQGRHPLLVACDIYRPAARRQLQVLGEQLKTPVFVGDEDAAPPDTAAAAVRHAAKNGLDVVIVDTAGRLHIDDAMMAELEQMKAQVGPHETLLVVDAMTGQDSVTFAAHFHERLNVSGFILTKMDGDARGGAALSIRNVTGVPVKFVGLGEKLDSLEAFHPDRMASRILGMGDVISLIEKAEEAFDQKQKVEMERKLRESRYDLNDFLDHLQQVRRMGPLEQVLGMIPGLGNMRDVRVDEGQVARQEAIIRSMTPAERTDPSVLNGNRKRRIAVGCGQSVQEINQFLHQFDQMRQMVRQMMGAQGGARKGKPRLRLPVHH